MPTPAPGPLWLGRRGAGRQARVNAGAGKAQVLGLDQLESRQGTQRLFFNRRRLPGLRTESVEFASVGNPPVYGEIGKNAIEEGLERMIRVVPHL
jgi:hypothetical protein